jgi:signal transduction histidine kinase
VVDSEVPRFLVQHLGRGRLIALDALMAFGFTGLLLGFTAVGEQPAAVPPWAAYLVVAGIGLPLAVRRRWPVPVFCLVFAMTVASAVLQVVREPFVAAGLALYQVAVAEPRRLRVPTTAIGAISLLAILVASLGGTAGAPPSVSELFGLVVTGSAVLGGAWTVGRAVRARRAYATQAAEQRADRAVAEERLRIARELHDVVTHSMGLIAVKAGVANHVLRSRPREAHDALQVIEATSRRALTEMRHMLGVLRSNVDEGEPGLDPVPRLAALAILTERTEMAGVPVDLTVRDVDQVPDGVGLSAYRILQEALTNVVKHAGPTRCRVRVEGGAGEVKVVVSNEGGTGRRPPAATEGHGITGMRERAALYGGTLTAGPLPDGGFEVRARLPYRPDDAGVR